MTAPPTADEDVPIDRETDAQAVIQEVLDEWDHRAKGVEELLDTVSSELADAANHRLRQLLTRLSTELELATEQTPDGPRAVLEPERLRRVQQAIGELSRVLVTHLDRNQVAKQLIQLDRTTVDLSTLVPDALRREGIPVEAPDVEIEVDPSPARGDPEKLRTVVAVLAARFWTASGEGDVLKVTVTDDGGDRLRGFIGLDPCPVDRNELIERLDGPLDLGSLEPNLPYARAVLERHGGNLYVVGQGEEALGYGFTLPKEEAEP